MIKFSCRCSGRYKDDTIWNCSFLSVNRIVEYDKIIWTLFSSRICGRTAFIKTNCRNTSSLNHQLCSMIETKTIIRIRGIDLDRNNLSISRYSETGTRINLLSLIIWARIISKLVFTVINNHLISLHSFGNPILILCPCAFLINHCCAIFEYRKERIVITFRIGAVYFAINCKCTARLTCGCVEECSINSCNHLIVFAGMVCFSRSNLIG